MIIDDLYRVKELKRIIDNLTIRINELQSATEYKGSKIDTIGGSKGSNDNDTMCDNVVKLIELKEARGKAEHEYKYLNIAILVMMEIEKLTDLERFIIIRRYSMNDKWEHIIDMLNYSESHIYKTHKKALKKLKNNVK